MKTYSKRSAVVTLCAVIGLLLPAGTALGVDEIAGSLTVTSDRYHRIGKGMTLAQSSVSGDHFRVSGSQAQVNFFIDGKDGRSWYLSLVAPQNYSLAPGRYVRAGSTASKAPTVPGISFSGAGGGCSDSGSFTILGIAFDPSNRLQSLHAAFEHHCNGGSPALRGEIRAGSTAADAPQPLPQVPVYPDLNVTPAFLRLESDKGDWVGLGGVLGFSGRYRFVASDLDYFSWHIEPSNELRIRMLGAEGEDWSINLAAPGRGRLVPGSYQNASTPAHSPLLGVSGNGHACNGSTAGSFEVLRAEFRPDGRLEKFHSTFQQPCDGDSAMLRGEVSLGIADPPALAVLDDQAAGWGYNGQSQLGDGSQATRASGVTVGDPGKFMSVDTDGLHSLGVKDDGTVWAWGWNALGQLGDGTTVDRSSPVMVSGLTEVVAVSAGLGHSLALKRDGTVWAWGWNALGQLGDGTSTDKLFPVRVRDLDHVTSISAGWLHNLALQEATVWAWGFNSNGQIGDGSTIDRHSPVVVPDLNYIQSISAGGLHSLAVEDYFLGQVHAWGSNILGQLGDETQVDRHRPVHVHYGQDLITISAGMLHNLALSRDRELVGWGWNGTGQLGNTTIPPDFRCPASTASIRVCPVPVTGMNLVNSFSAGGYHSLVTREDGSMHAFGWNVLGQLGDGTTEDHFLAAPISGPGTPVEVSAGWLSSLALFR